MTGVAPRVAASEGKLHQSKFRANASSQARETASESSGPSRRASQELQPRDSQERGSRELQHRSLRDRSPHSSQELRSHGEPHDPHPPNVNWCENPALALLAAGVPHQLRRNVVLLNGMCQWPPSATGL